VPEKLPDLIFEIEFFLTNEFWQKTMTAAGEPSRKEEVTGQGKIVIKPQIQ
jgi:hypothetical protein